jgi:hypothetical protein
MEESPLVIDGKMDLERLSELIMDRLDELGMGKTGLPVVRDIVFLGSMLYLSDENNRLSIQAMGNPDLIGDIDLAVFTGSPGEELSTERKRLLGETLRQEVPNLIRQRLAPYGIQFERAIDPLVNITTDDLEEMVSKEAEYVVEGYSEPASWPDDPLGLAKVCIKLEQLVGDENLYRDYRDRLVSAQNPREEALAILKETSQKGPERGFAEGARRPVGRLLCGATAHG